MGYTEDWWIVNRAKVNAERNKRYQKDPEYRKKARERARKYREQRRAEREAELSNPTLTVGGVEVPALTTQQVCQIAGITASRIKYMQRTGYLPNALVTRPIRFYTQRQAETIRDLEVFLRANQDILRGPETPESRAVAEKVAAYIATVKENWQTI